MGFSRKEYWSELVNCCVLLQYSCLKNPMDGRAWGYSPWGRRVGQYWATSPSPSPPGNLGFKGREKVQRRGSQPLRWRWQGSGQDQKESWKYLLPRMTEKRATCMYTGNCFMWVRNFLKGIRKKKNGKGEDKYFLTIRFSPWIYLNIPQYFCKLLIRFWNGYCRQKVLLMEILENNLFIYLPVSP